MGIRFLCPNGHKLNVKAFLAGKRGICPQCDAKFLVPATSGGQADAIHEAVASQPTARVPSDTSTTGFTQDHTELPPVAPPNSPSEPVAPPEAWYVRTTTGEQFGPASLEVMQDWISAGRITVDCWVWRTGWAEWKTGGQAMTSLNMAMPEQNTPGSLPPVLSTSETLPSEIAITPTPSLLPEATSPTALYRSTKRSRQERARKATLFLGVVVLLLFVVLVAVLINNSR